MAGWIKMQLGMEVGLGPGDFVLGKEGNRRSGVALAMRHRLEWFIHLRSQGLSTAPPPQKGAEPPPNFQSMSIMAKRLDGSR